MDRRSRATDQKGWSSWIAAWAAPGPSEPVLFFAERDPAVLFGAWALVVVVMLPFGLAIPDRFLAGACLSLLSAWLCLRSFRFELTRNRLGYRPNLVAPSVWVRLSDIEAVMVTSLFGRPVEAGRPGPRRGHLLIRTDRTVIVVKSIRDPREAADAIEVLRRGKQI